MTVTAEAEPLVCCRPFTNLTETQRGQWAWQALHQLCHNRTAFTVERLAELARVDVATARQMVKEAHQLKWLRNATDRSLIGRLARGGR